VWSTWFMSEILDHISLNQIDAFSESFGRDVRALILADKLRYAIPMEHLGSDFCLLDTDGLPDTASNTIEELKPSDYEGIFGHIDFCKDARAPTPMDIDNAEVREISMPPPRTEPKYIYFRGSKICTEPRSGINFVIEFETNSGTPLSLWRKLVLNNEIVYRLGVVMCGELRQTATSPFAGTLLLGEFSVEELEYLTGQKISASSQPRTVYEQPKQRENRLSKELPEFKPTNNRVAHTICLWANRFVTERSLEPTENDLWEFMWAHKDECGLQMSRSPGGIETYFLVGAEIDLADLRHRLSTYRVPFIGKK